MGIPFQNGPTSGEDVFVPLDAIIGGRDGAGQGWKMLMECLATGRAISLPSVAAAAAKVSARAASAYAIVREQFDTPIGRFEGVEEPLARIAGLTYAIDAASRLTAAAIDAGEQPAVLSAIVKAYCTELMRDVVNDAMDIRAGAAIMRGPRNIIGRAYASIPIGDHGRGRQHPDALDDHLRPGRDPLPPVRARGDARGARPATSSASIARSSATSRFALTTAARAFVLGLSNGAARPRARPAARCAATCSGSRALSRGVRARLGGRDGDARRRAQAARSAHGPPRRRARVALSRLGGR